MKYLLLFSFFITSNIPSLMEIKNPEVALSETTCQTGFSSNVTVKAIQKYGRPYGYSVWMKANNNQLKAQYFAQSLHNQSVYNRYMSWQSPKRTIAFTSAAYTLSDNYTSKGLTIENGAVINSNFDSEMDALVVLYRGDILIFDTKNPFHFKEIGQLNLSNGFARQRLISWSRSNGATVFQTHLLVSDNELKITTAARKKIARRKVLVQISKNYEDYTIIFYIKRGEYLFDAAQNIQSLLQSYSNVTIKSMINLDTGVNDVLGLDGSLSLCNRQEVKGREQPNLATNILSFYYSYN